MNKAIKKTKIDANRCEFALGVQHWDVEASMQVENVLALSRNIDSNLEGLEERASNVQDK